MSTTIAQKCTSPRANRQACGSMTVVGAGILVGTFTIPVGDSWPQESPAAYAPA